MAHATIESQHLPQAAPVSLLPVTPTVDTTPKVHTIVVASAEHD